MSDILSALNKIQNEETDFNSPASEALNTKFGANINALIDLITAGYQVFTSNTTWLCPDDVNQVQLYGCGGGSGGGQYSGISAENAPGGVGCVPQSAVVAVTPGVTYSITIGAGGLGNAGAGSGPGLAGGNTVFGAGLVTLRGAPTAPLATAPSSTIPSNSTATERNNRLYDGAMYCLGGAGGVAVTGVTGTNTPTGAGGLCAFDVNGSATGGGGGAGYGNGGNGGGFGGTGTVAATVGGFGAGGGGGRSNEGGGRNGGQGILFLKT